MCKRTGLLFCFYCTKAQTKQSLTVSTKADPSFTRVGFSNWKRLCICFSKHESYHSHFEAVMKVKKPPNIGAMLDKNCKQQQRSRQQMLLKQLSSLKYLTCQGLAIRGHIDKEENLFQLLKLRADDDLELQRWLTEAEYMSPKIVNKQIQFMALSLLRSLLSEIQSVPWFSVLADETTDISFHEQMCVVIRWINDDHDILEEPVGLMEVPKADAETLTSSLKDVLIRCVLPLDQCRGQAYDGAANMSGRLREVAARIRNEQPKALHVHCLAHCLNLCLQDTARICTIVRDTLQLVIEVVNIIKYSPKRSSFFHTVKSQLSPMANDLRPLCPTRWTVRSSSISAVLANYSTLSSVLEQINETGKDEYAVKAGGLAKQLQTFNVYFGLKLCQLVFDPTEQLSRTLQGRDTTIQEAKQAALIIKDYLTNKRTDTCFSKFHDRVARDAQSLTDDPVFQGSVKFLADWMTELRRFSTGHQRNFTGRSILKPWML